MPRSQATPGGSGPGASLSPYDAHAFQPGDAAHADRCALCGELRQQIRHHPTRVAAARLLREGEPAARPKGGDGEAGSASKGGA